MELLLFNSYSITRMSYPDPPLNRFVHLCKKHGLTKPVYPTVLLLYYTITDSCFNAFCLCKQLKLELKLGMRFAIFLAGMDLAPHPYMTYFSRIVFKILLKYRERHSFLVQPEGQEVISSSAPPPPRKIP